jgi:predicted RNA binding protein YcfA (HicA-like mRNA interferase family)
VSDRLPRHEGRELVRALERAGFVESRPHGSHLHLFRSTDRKRVTVPMSAGRTIPIGTLAGILRDIGMSAERLRELL